MIHLVAGWFGSLMMFNEDSFKTSMLEMNRSFTSETSTAENDRLYNCIKKTTRIAFKASQVNYSILPIPWPIFEGRNPKMNSNNLCEEKA